MEPTIRARRRPRVCGQSRHCQHWVARERGTIDRGTGRGRGVARARRSRPGLPPRPRRPPVVTTEVTACAEATAPRDRGSARVRLRPTRARRGNAAPGTEVSTGGPAARERGSAGKGPSDATMLRDRTPVPRVRIEVARHRVSAAPAIRGSGRGRTGRRSQVPRGRGHRPPSRDAAGSQPVQFEAPAESTQGRPNAAPREASPCGSRLRPRARRAGGTRNRGRPAHAARGSGRGHARQAERDLAGAGDDPSRAPRDCGTPSFGSGRGFVVRRLRGRADAGRRHGGAARRSRRPRLRPRTTAPPRRADVEAGRFRPPGVRGQQVGTAAASAVAGRPKAPAADARTSLGSQRHGAAPLRARTHAASSQGRGRPDNGSGRGRASGPRAGRGRGCGAGTQRSASSCIPGAQAATPGRGGGRAWPQDGREAQESNERRFGLIGWAATTDSLRGATP